MSTKFLQLATCTNCKCNNALHTWVKVVYVNCTAIFLQVKLTWLQHWHLVTICLNPATKAYMQSTLDLKQTWKPSQNSHYCLFVSISNLLPSVENFSPLTFTGFCMGPFSKLCLCIFHLNTFFITFSVLSNLSTHLRSAKFTEANNTLSVPEWLNKPMHTWVQKQNHCTKQMLMTDCSHRLPDLLEDQPAGYTPAVSGWQYCGPPSSHSPRLWYTHQLHCLQIVGCLEWPLTYKQITLWIK
jgi:hypothetical protein